MVGCVHGPLRCEKEVIIEDEGAVQEQQYWTLRPAPSVSKHCAVRHAGQKQCLSRSKVWSCVRG